jgi:hypothetical protein
MPSSYEEAPTECEPRLARGFLLEPFHFGVGALRPLAATLAVAASGLPTGDQSSAARATREQQLLARSG